MENSKEACFPIIVFWFQPKHMWTRCKFHFQCVVETECHTFSLNIEVYNQWRSCAVQCGSYYTVCSCYHKQSGRISLVCAPHGLLLVGGYLTGLLRETLENREKRSALSSEVLREKRSNPSARAKVESGVWKKLCRQQYIWVQPCSLSRNRAKLSASGGYLRSEFRVLRDRFTKSEHVIDKSWPQTDITRLWTNVTEK